MLRFSFGCLRPQMRTSFHHQPEAQHPNFQLSTSWQADYPIFGSSATEVVKATLRRLSGLPPKADIDRHDWHVRFVPEAAVSRCSNTHAEFLTLPPRGEEL